MDPSKWYEGQTQQYYPLAPFPPNPSVIVPTPVPAPVPGPATSYTHDAGVAVAPPGVGVQGPNSYAPQVGYEGHASSYVYPAVSVAPGYGVGADAQGFVAHPVAHADQEDSRTFKQIWHGRADVLKRTIRLIEDWSSINSVLHQTTFLIVCLGYWSTVVYTFKRKGGGNLLDAENNNATCPHHIGAIWKKKKKIPKAIQSAYCEVCKIICNSQEVLNSHRQGKKHKKNLEKLKESIVPNPAKAPMKLVENKETPETEMDKTGGEKTKKKAAPATEVDLETKRRKVLEGGAAATAVKVCTLCNVVCNSEVVFEFHIAGQKHAAMVKKQLAAPAT
ncbi:hypothetical protein Taro_007902 [Colocasia esculenta]|uniref:Uncharacterized protein n=1 Tax=Colocasia esculenta TaxID=4460 RepID=A0A843U5D4_COLES|nr:hypothetical protein [Colocasia esculenta]